MFPNALFPNAMFRSRRAVNFFDLTVFKRMQQTPVEGATYRRTASGRNDQPTRPPMLSAPGA